jgi:AcrR family transcriptional regulator
MARPRSDAKRVAILQAATRVIVTQGLGATTAGIAKEAGVANGSLFTYFATKTDLLNQLYLELKKELAEVSLRRLPSDAGLRQQMYHAWKSWAEWAVSNPDKRRALAQLSVSDEITAETRMEGMKVMAGIFELFERCRSRGAVRNVPPAFAGALINAASEATMDFMAGDPSHAKKHCKAGFDAVWRMIE